MSAWLQNNRGVYQNECNVTMGGRSLWIPKNDYLIYWLPLFDFHLEYKYMIVCWPPYGIICNWQVSIAGPGSNVFIIRSPSALVTIVAIFVFVFVFLFYIFVTNTQSTSVLSRCNVFTARPPPPSSAFFVAHNICPSDIFLLRPWSTHK